MKLISLLVVCLCIFSPLMGKKLNHQRSGVSIWFPDHWRVKKADGVIHAGSPDGGAFAQYNLIPNVSTIQQAKGQYQRYLGRQVQNFQVKRELKQFTRKNMVFKAIGGVGFVNGAGWSINVFLVKTPKGVAMLVQRARSGSSSKYKTPFTNIVESIKLL